MYSAFGGSGDPFFVADGCCPKTERHNEVRRTGNRGRGNKEHCSVAGFRLARSEMETLKTSLYGHPTYKHFERIISYVNIM